MCPESDFGREYRALIKTYRLTPEAAACQMDMILDRFFSEADSGCDQSSSKPEKKEKGGAST